MKKFNLIMAALLPLGIYAQDPGPSEYYPVSEPSIQYTTAGGKVSVGISGQLKATANFDFGSSTLENPNEFIVSEIPMDPGKGNGSRFGLSAQQSELNLMFKYLPGDKHQVGAYFSTYLLGDNYLPRLNYAFLTYRGILAGYNYTIFADQDAGVHTIDYEGPLAYTAVQNGVFDLAGKWGKVTAGIGLELPKASFEPTASYRSCAQKVPDVPVFLKYSIDDCSWIRLSAVARNLFYYDELAGKTKDTFGWGLQFSGGVELTSRIHALWQVTAGEGVSNYIQDLCDGGYDMTPSTSGSGMKPVSLWGGYLGLSFQWSDKFQSNIAYSHLRLYNDENAVAPDYDYGQYAVANIFYALNDNFEWGLEYIWGRKVTRETPRSKHDNRLQTSLCFSF